jgi:hypothetical protein
MFVCPVLIESFPLFLLFPPLNLTNFSVHTEMASTRPRENSLHNPQSLVNLCIIYLASNSFILEAQKDLQGVPEELVGGLLHEILRKGNLTYKLAMVFARSDSDSIKSWIASLDLIAGVSDLNLTADCKVSR